jgi:hypothetical protein
MHMRDPAQHSVWGGEHEQWKYSRAQAPHASVWQYPSQGGQEYHEWGSARAAPQGSPQQGGYYYVPSGRDQREEYPYDMGSRSYMYPQAHMSYYNGSAGSSLGSRPLPPPAVGPYVSPEAVVSNSPKVPAGGAASFLFEAAAAAAAAAAGGPTPSKPPHSPPPPPQLEVSPKESTNSAIEGIASTQIIPGRQNNHHSRLHATGTEKAPLVSHSGQGSSITTLMIRNIPNRYMQSELLAEIREAGYDKKFDFFYLPMDHETHANFGYAFINFIDERTVEPFTKRFNGLKLNRFTSNKIIQIVPAQLQGFQANLQHYCKKAVCTDDNVDYRPLFFVDGKCLEFHRAADFTNAGVSPEIAREVDRRPPRNNGAARHNFQRKNAK